MNLKLFLYINRCIILLILLISKLDATELQTINETLSNLSALSENILTYDNARGMLDSVITNLRLYRDENLTSYYYGGGYCWENLYVSKEDKLFQGLTKTTNLNDLYKASNLRPTSVGQVKEELVNNYKIHLMPKTTNDLKKILQILVEHAITDDKFRKSIHTLKVSIKANFNSIESLKGSLKLWNRDLNKDIYLPIVVIYPSSSKEAAEYVLNTLIKLYKNIEGANISPRYNQRVNSLIYYAQGDGDYKHENNAGYYSTERNENAVDGRAFYASTFQGAKNDYSLKIRD